MYGSGLAQAHWSSAFASAGALRSSGRKTFLQKKYKYDISFDCEIGDIFGGEQPDLTHVDGIAALLVP